MKNFIIYLSTVSIPLLYLMTYYTINPLDCLGLVVGVGVWSIAEYGFHRFAFHNNHLSPETHQLLAYNHAHHHEQPDNTNNLFLPLRLVMPIAALLFVCVFAFGGFPFAVLFLLGVFGGLCFYEFVHYQAHHKFYNVWPLNCLTRRHLRHHYENEAALFGVTSPIMDIIFRTNGQLRSSSLYHKQK